MFLSTRLASVGICFGVALVLALPAAAAQTSASKVDPALCRALTKYTPEPNVAYQPGVDVHGNAVAPADVPGSSQLTPPSVIKIPLTLGLAQSLHFDTSKYPYNQLGAGTETTLGVISVEGDKVSFNGQPLSDSEQDRLSVLCMKAQ